MGEPRSADPHGRAPGSRILEGLAAALLVVLMLVVLIDVLGRSLLNMPLPWGTELLEVVQGAMIFLLYPLLALNSGHITVDLIKPSQGVRRVQSVLGALIGAVLFALVAACLGRLAARSAEYGEATPLLAIPYSLVLGGMAVLAGIAALCFLVAATRSLRRKRVARQLGAAEVV